MISFWCFYKSSNKVTSTIQYTYWHILSLKRCMFLIPFLIQIINPQLSVPLSDVELDLRAWAWEWVVLILLQVKSTMSFCSLGTEMHRNFYLSQILMFLETPQAQRQQVCQWLVLLLILGACWLCWPCWPDTTPPVLRAEKGTAEPNQHTNYENSWPSAKKVGNEADKLQGWVVRIYCTETLLFVRGESNLFFSYR